MGIFIHIGIFLCFLCFIHKKTTQTIFRFIYSMKKDFVSLSSELKLCSVHPNVAVILFFYGTR